MKTFAVIWGLAFYLSGLAAFIFAIHNIIVGEGDVWGPLTFTVVVLGTGAVVFSINALIASTRNPLLKRR
jgi:hypothetical protein